MNSSSSNNIDNIDNNIELMNNLFKKVFSNIFIRNNIMFHVRLFHIHMKVLYFSSFKEILNYKYRGYLNSIQINGNEENEESELIEIVSIGDIPSCVTNLIVNTELAYFKPNSIPDSVTSINFNQCHPKQSFKSLISENVKTLTLGEYFTKTIKIGDLPSTLLNIIIDPLCSCIIENGSIHSSTIINNNNNNNNNNNSNNNNNNSNNELEFKFYDDNNNLKIQDNPIPDSITSLILSDTFNQELKIGDLPSSLTSLTFGEEFNIPISEGVLPIGLKKIKFGYDFNQPIQNNSLPSSLISITFGGAFNQTLTNENFPSDSVEILKFGYQFTVPILQLQFTKLKSLEFGDQWEHIIPVGWLPNTLESLDLGGYDRPLVEGTLPNSLKLLYIGHQFQHDILIGQLPSNISSLSIGGQIPYNFKAGVLPSNLKTLLLTSPNQKDFSAENCLPPNLESIYTYSNTPPIINTETLPSSFKYFNCTQYNTDLINHFDFSFIFKYFKYNSDFKD